MDTLLPPRPWYIRHRFPLLLGLIIGSFIVYAITLSAGPSQLRIDANQVQVGEAMNAPFLEYIDVEGLVQPIRTQRINTLESGCVTHILAEEGQTLHAGDTILILSNPDLEQTIADLRDELERQETSYQEKLLEQEKLRLSLSKQALQTSHEQQRLDKNIQLDREEHRMGIKSKVQLDLSEDEYRYQQQRTELELLSLRNDSATASLRAQIMERDMEREKKKYLRSAARLQDLVVRAPCDGQLSFISATLGQRVSSSEQIAEIKVLTSYKVHAALNEYYVERISAGLPASIYQQGQTYPLHISRVVPEVHNRTFDVDLVFEGDCPSNIRIGKSYMVKVELGKADSTIVIPRGDFYQHTGGRWLYRLDDSGKRALRTPVKIGRQNPSQYEIIEGLQPGDRIITSGYDHLGDTEVLILK